MLTQTVARRASSRSDIIILRVRHFAVRSGDIVPVYMVDKLVGLPAYIFQVVSRWKGSSMSSSLLGELLSSKLPARLPGR